MKIDRNTLKKLIEQREVVKPVIEKAPTPSESDAVVNEADAILKALEHRDLLKQLSKRLKG